MYRDKLYVGIVVGFALSTLFMLVALVISFPVVVYAETGGAPVDPVPDLGGFWTAMGDQHWPLAVGIGLTLLVWLVRTFVKHKLPPKVIPYVTLGLAVIGTAGSRMVQAINTGVPWWQGLVQGVLEGATVGFSAMGWWSTGMKKLPLKKEEGDG
jgi:hypothetical protein